MHLQVTINTQFRYRLSIEASVHCLHIDSWCNSDIRLIARHPFSVVYLSCNSLTVSEYLL